MWRSVSQVNQNSPVMHMLHTMQKLTFPDLCTRKTTSNLFAMRKRTCFHIWYGSKWTVTIYKKIIDQNVSVDTLLIKWALKKQPQQWQQECHQTRDLMSRTMDVQVHQGLHPFSETNSQDFSRTQIDLSRALKFTLTPTLSDLNVNPPYCLPFTSYYLVEFDIFPELSRTSDLFQDFPVLENARTFQVFQDPYKPCAL